MTQTNFEMALAALILLGRLGDVFSTKLATPNLVLEANPVIRRLGWRFALASLLLAFIPFYNTAAGVLVLVPSLLVTGSNFSKAWVLRAVGEHQYYALLRASVTRLPSWVPYSCVLASASAFALSGGILLVLSGGLSSWPGWFAAGIVTYGLAIGLHGSLFVRRLYRAAEQAPSSAAV
jgi:hypothetical protein